MQDTPATSTLIRHTRLLALAAMCSLAACGGGSSSHATAPSAPSTPVVTPPNPPTPTPTPPAPPPSSSPDTCTVNGQAWAVCATDAGGWAFEQGKYCIARSFCPSKRTSLPSGAGASAPADPLATSSTRAVYSWLRATWGKSIISGQSDLTWKDSIDMAERVHADTGKYPALMGYDFMNYGMTASWAEGRQQTEEAIAWAKRGGLVEFSWHWRDPALLNTSQVNNANFYAREPDAGKNTGFTIPVAQGALDTSSPAYQHINDGIDLIAAELKRLQSSGVTVLWRPLHEASGSNGDGWFWWGRKRSDGVPQAYANILLWRHMHARLTQMHGVHNLIWVWNGQDPAWYPGDDVVDVTSYDIYDGNDQQTYGAQLPTYLRAQMSTQAGKLIALSENSYIPDPDKIAADGAWWLWFMTWSDGDGPAGVSNPNNFWTGEAYNTAAHKLKVYHHPQVITLERMPKF